MHYSLVGNFGRPQNKKIILPQTLSAWENFLNSYMYQLLRTCHPYADNISKNHNDKTESPRISSENPAEQLQTKR